MSEPLIPKDIDSTVDSFRTLRDRANEAGQTAALGKVLRAMAATEEITNELLSPVARPAPPHIRDVIQPSGVAPQTPQGQQRRQAYNERASNGGDRTLST